MPSRLALSSSARLAARQSRKTPQTRIPRPAISRCAQTRLFSSSSNPPSHSAEAAAPPAAGRFSYHAAASFSSKPGKLDSKPHDRLDPLTNIFHFNRYNRIQPTKRPKWKRPASGQDAFFIARIGESNALAFGVADGVGGWEESGVDPADFSHGLCDYMASAACLHAPDAAGSLPPARYIMQKAYDDVCHDKTIAAGGSTACVAVASEHGTLDVANLGDSGFAQLRLNAVHSYSEPQTHAFNTPYQLSVIPASMLARAAAFGGAQLCDYPEDADVTQHELQHGDILVFASDGVWDNLFNNDILKIASRLMKDTGAWQTSADGGVRVADSLEPFTTQDMDATEQRAWTLQSKLAHEILGAAKSASQNRRLDGPFAKEVQKYYPQEHWHGGKVDDICVVVVLVTEEGRTPAVSANL